MSNLLNILSQFNGWQRAWVLCSVIWLFSIIIYGFIAFPSRTEKIEEIKIDSFYSFPVKDTSSCHILNLPEASPQCYEWVNDLNRITTEKRQEYYEERFKDTEGDQTNFLGGLFALWIFTSLGLYAFGFGMAWVMHGFNKSK